MRTVTIPQVIVDEVNAELSEAKSRTLSGLQARVNEWAKEKGWREKRGTTAVERIALMHCELSEAVEEIRGGFAPDDVYYRTEDGFKTEWAAQPNGTLNKPEGVGVELADVIIRILDFAGAHGIDIERLVLEKLAFNDGRPYRHGGKAL